MSSLPALEARRGQLIDDIATRQALVTNNETQIRRAEGVLAFPGSTEQQKIQARGQITSLRQSNIEYQAQINSLTRQLAEVDAQIAALRQQQQGPKDSAGQEALQDQQANEDGANVTKPQAAAPSPEVATNANRAVSPTTSNTNPPVKKASNLQSTNPTISTANPGPVRPNGPDDNNARPGGTAGAAVGGEDAAQINEVKQYLNKIFGSNQKIVATPNPLDAYASYTYNISIYLMAPQEYKKLLYTQQKNISGYQLLMSTGGAPISSGNQYKIDPNIAIDDVAPEIIRKQQAEAGRNPYFPLDFYIDDVKLQSVVQGRGSRSAHNVFQLDFKIIEPNGISLLDWLFKATQEYCNQSPGPRAQNYAAQNYLMVIKFYGYDDQGNLVRPTIRTKPSGGADKDAIIEKWIPFQFTTVKFRVANKLTEYECSAVCPMNNISFNQQRGVIPYNVELTATSLQDFLVGNGRSTTVQQTNPQTDRQGNQSSVGNNPVAVTNANAGRDATVYSLEFGGFDALGTYAADFSQVAEVDATKTSTTSKAPPKANSAPSAKVITKGLATSLNNWQEEQKAAGYISVPDKYEIIIKDEVLQKAKVVPPGKINKNQQGMGPGPTAPAADQKLGSKQSANNDSQNKSITAGTSIIQVIDLAIRSSEYILQQQLYLIDRETGREIPNGTPAETVGWYHVSSSAEPIEYDYLRNDYAYKITYQISVYAITDPKSDWFPLSVFRGVQKSYPYWFTGQNTQVLDYQQDYNYLYYITTNAPVRNPSVYVDAREYTKLAFQTRSNEAGQGDTGKTFEGGANLAESLYSPADTARARLSIVGDPDWIQQGEILFGPAKSINYAAFFQDGTINYDSQEPVFEVLFNKPVDYDLDTGLIDPGQKNYNANRKEGIAGDAAVSYTYRAITVTSTFAKGKFTQEIMGAQVFFPVPTAQAKQATQRVADTQQSRPTVNVSRAISNASPAVQSATKATDWAKDFKNAPSQATNPQSAAAQLANQAVLPSRDALAATSNGQVVGPAPSQIVSTQTGGATGTNVGQPVQVNVYLNNGRITQVTSEQEIRTALQNQQITPQEASRATNSLRIWQNAANNPVTSAPRQLKAIEK